MKANKIEIMKIDEQVKKVKGNKGKNEPGISFRGGFSLY